MISQIKKDMHWTPVYSFCNPCQVNMSHVVKFETFDRDQAEILALAGIQDKVDEGLFALCDSNSIMRHIVHMTI